MPLNENSKNLSTFYLSSDSDGFLHWGALTPGRLIRRYKRFLADVELEDGHLVTAHTPNTGRMQGCSEPGRPVWLSHHDKPGRKYSYTLEMISMPGALVGVNTMLPNRLVAEAARAGHLPEMPGRLLVEREVSVGRSRLDLRLTDERGRVAMVEVKNCTLVEKGVAYFPDAVTARGEKHLRDLAELAKNGLRAVIFILVQRSDAKSFSPADHIDSAWSQRLREVSAEGVEIWAYQAELNLEKIGLGRRLPVLLHSGKL